VCACVCVCVCAVVCVSDHMYARKYAYMSPYFFAIPYVGGDYALVQNQIELNSICL